MSPAASAADALRHGIGYRLKPVLSALSLLADSQRVLTAVAGVAGQDEVLRDRLTAACDTWRNPTGSGGDANVLAVLVGLADVCVDMATELADQAGEVMDLIEALEQGSSV